jgi:hypothetical protein
MRKEKFLYWNYYVPENTLKTPVIVSFFDIGDYKDKYIFLHVSSKISFNIQNDYKLQELEQYVYPISKLEEDMLLDEMGDVGKRQYAMRLKSLNIDENYKLYSFSITSESIYLLTKFLEETLERPIKISLGNLE